MTHLLTECSIYVNILRLSYIFQWAQCGRFRMVEFYGTPKHQIGSFGTMRKSTMLGPGPDPRAVRAPGRPMRGLGGRPGTSSWVPI